MRTSLCFRPADRFRVRAFVGAWLLICSLGSGGCEAPDDPLIGAPPAIPEISLQHFEPAVRLQIGGLLETLGQSPADAYANRELARHLHAYGHLDEAASLYRRAATFDPRAHIGWHLLGLVERKMGRLDAARRALERAWAVDGSKEATAVALGELTLEAGALDGAERWFERASKTSLAAGLGLAQVALRRSRLDDAERRFLDVLERERGVTSARHGLARVYRLRGEPALAEKALAKSLPIDQPPPGENRNKCIEPLRDPFLVELEELRVDKQTLFRKGARLFENGEMRQALATYEKVLRFEPDAALALYNSARCRQALGEHRQAIAIYERLLRTRPEHADASGNLGIAHLELGQVDAAIEAFREAIKRDPSHTPAQRNLALAWLRKGDSKRAVGVLLDTLRESPEEQASHELLLRALGVEGAPAARDLHRAALLLEESGCSAAAFHALRQGGGLPGAWRNQVTRAALLVSCRDAKLRDPQKALRILEPLCRETAASDAIALDTLARVYAANERLDDAVLTATNALAIARSRLPKSAALVARIEARLATYRAAGTQDDE